MRKKDFCIVWPENSKSRDRAPLKLIVVLRMPLLMKIIELSDFINIQHYKQRQKQTLFPVLSAGFYYFLCVMIGLLDQFSASTFISY